MSLFQVWVLNKTRGELQNVFNKDDIENKDMAPGKRELPGM